MDQESIKEVREFWTWCGLIIGVILISPALAIAVSVLPMMIRFYPRGGGSAPGSGLVDLGLVYGVFPYVITCMVIGSIFILLASIGYWASSRPVAKENENPYLKPRINRWYTVGASCKGLGCVLLASWLHLPVILKYSPNLIALLIAPTVLGVVLLVVGSAIIRFSPKNGSHWD